MHICISKLTIIGSDDGWLPGCRQAIIWTNAAILIIEPLKINFSEKNAFENVACEMATILFGRDELKEKNEPTTASIKAPPFT